MGTYLLATTALKESSEAVSSECERVLEEEEEAGEMLTTEGSLPERCSVRDAADAMTIAKLRKASKNAVLKRCMVQRGKWWTALGREGGEEA